MNCLTRSSLETKVISRSPATLLFSHTSTFFLTFLISSLSTRSLTIAQSPILFYNASALNYGAFARTVNKLYVSGGILPSSAESYFLGPDLIVLDLAVPWNITTPAWSRLADSPKDEHLVAAFSSDEQTFFNFHIKGSNSPFQFNVKDNKWQKSTAAFQNTLWRGISAVTDPNTGLIYLAGGYDDINYNSPYLKALDIFDPITQSIRTIDLPDPAEALPVRSYYGNVWSKYRNSILYWGGNNMSPSDPDVVQNGVTELNTNTTTWSTMVTQGQAPEARIGHCMAANDDGTKIVITGGELRNGTLVGDLWILDTTTSTWSQGLSGPPRSDAVCAFAGDQLVLWGGRRAKIESAVPTMVIYNFASSTYVQQYTPPIFYKDRKPPPPITRTVAPWVTKALVDPPKENKNSDRSPTLNGVVIGGAVAGLLLIGVIAAIVVVLRRKGQDESESSGLIRLLGKGRSNYGGAKPKKAPQHIDEEQKLEQTLEELEAQQKELEDQKKELGQKRQLLVLQHQESNPRSDTTQIRGPTAFANDYIEIIPPLDPLLRPKTDEAYLMSYSEENLNDRRTVQAVTGPVDMYEGDSYADNEPRREGEMVQETIEPRYGPSPEVNSAIPDVIYKPSRDVGMDWTRNQQPNHPHTIVHPS